LHYTEWKCVKYQTTADLMSQLEPHRWYLWPSTVSSWVPSAQSQHFLLKLQTWRQAISLLGPIKNKTAEPHINR
jgi:hypothetical protein